MTDGVIKYDFVREDATPPDAAVVEELEAVRSRLFALGLIGVREGIGYGNLSRRSDGGAFVVTATQTGHLPALAREHYVSVTACDDRNFSLRYRGAAKPSSESLTHGTIYGLDPRIGAVIHVHSRALWRHLLDSGSPATADVAYGSREMIDAVEALYAGRDPFDIPVFAMRGHEEGVIALGRTPEEAEKALLRAAAEAFEAAGEKPAMRTVAFGGRRVAPSKIVCIGRNYVEHIEELGNEMPESMVFFHKPNSALGEALFFIDDTTRFEGEICFLIEGGEIAGVGFGLDLTRAEVQNRLKRKGLPWERAKAFDASAVMGTFVPYRGDGSDLRMELRINDTLVQSADYALMIHKPSAILEEIGGYTTLADGDIVMSGTPKGVSTYAPGDRFVGRIFSGEKLLCESRWRVENKENK